MGDRINSALLQPPYQGFYRVFRSQGGYNSGNRCGNSRPNIPALLSSRVLKFGVLAGVWLGWC